MHRRKRKLTPRFFGIIALVGMLLVLCMTFLLVRLLLTYIKSRDDYKQIVDETITQAPPTSIGANEPTPDPIADVSAQSASPTPIVIDLPITIDWLNLRAMNKQIIAWLYCEGTPLNYPIVQTKNNTYYLTHNAKRKDDQAGALFLDYRNNFGNDFENLIIYGHRMKDGSMFGKLVRFADSDYCDKHSEIYLLTPGGNYMITLFACRTVHCETKYFPTSFTNSSTEDIYKDKAIEQSYWQKAGQEKPEGAIMITFATCSKYEHADDPRLLVHGWAIPVVTK